VHSLSPPKPAGLAPQKFRRRTFYYMRKSLGITVFWFLEFFLEFFFWNFFWNFFFGIFFWKIYLKFFRGICFGFFSVKTMSVAKHSASLNKWGFMESEERGWQLKTFSRFSSTASLAPGEGPETKIQNPESCRTWNPWAKKAQKFQTPQSASFLKGHSNAF
jgi:hypothetical protein